ncbi:1-phosphatidylinositol 4,5-bisphosphate phosphodiesterase eta-2-like [Cottoperca gobio]|uniref:1-phosphatidylinositol 4,5-bisphosphate phosphodiesterase eta-2-like n=1 Tax=Cottoperca gobio TaxID=56716 RepID=A0A6J2Q2J4_COTGO|nr:1-phosphatidylinositol 4,5-bisphosphate phosphodiesterase eta-2 [Cottoperca gobio]
MPKIAGFHDSAYFWYLDDKPSKIHIYATLSKVRKHSKPNLLSENCILKCVPRKHVKRAKPWGHVEKCMSSMQMGTQMVKLRGGSKGLVRFFYLDEHKSCIRWRPSRKNEKAKISIDSVREVCEGKQSEIFQRYAEGSFDPNCCFSLYYGEHMESLDLVSSTGEEARTWITGLKYLMAGISDEDSLAKRQRTRDQWLKQTFTEADKNGDCSLSISEVMQLLHKLNVNLPRQKVKQMFKVWKQQGQSHIRAFTAENMVVTVGRIIVLGEPVLTFFVRLTVMLLFCFCQARAVSGIKGLFHRNPKQASLDSHAAAQHGRKHPFGAHLLRRTASAPTKGQPKFKKGFPEIAIDNKDYSSEGASEERESEDREKASAAASHQPTPPQIRNREPLASHQAKGPWERPDTNGAFHHEEGKDCSTVQKPAPLALNSDEARNTCVICSFSTPEDRLSLHHSSSTPLSSASTAINADSLLAIPSNGVVCSPIKVSGEHMKPSTLSRTTSLPLTNRSEKTVPLQCSQDIQTKRGTQLFMEHSPKQKENQEKVTEKKNDRVEFKSGHRVKPSAVAVSTEAPVVPAVETSQARRALFNYHPSHTQVRRTKSEGHVLVAVSSNGQAQSAVPEVCTDATMNDRLWSKLEPGSHRDSMSSSSSISSSDTVIDLSLPNLARKSLSSLPTVSSTCDPHWVNCRRSALVSYDALRVSKSKSIPNLQQSQCPRDELKPRPLQPDEAFVDSPSRLTHRRHTWSRLYMEGLKQSSASRQSSAATTPTVTASMSKSLGDLTSDDISCNFDSKYHSISRSFIVKPNRGRLRKGSPQRSRPPSDLTEQLRKLTDVEPLTASDFAPETKHTESQEDFVDESLGRRTSSRSQSRVRYIANRAKKAQERQRLQGLVQGRSASFSLTGSIGSGSIENPIEERGNPEGACCVVQSPCTSLDLLNQLTPLGTPSPTQPQSSPNPENGELFFMLKL